MKARVSRQSRRLFPEPLDVRHSQRCRGPQSLRAGLGSPAYILRLAEEPPTLLFARQEFQELERFALGQGFEQAGWHERLREFLMILEVGFGDDDGLGDGA